MSLSDDSKIIKDARVTGTPVVISMPGVSSSERDSVAQEDDKLDSDTAAGSVEEPAVISAPVVPVPKPRPDEELLAEARIEAARILDEAKKEAAEIRRIAESSGREEGLRAGTEQGRRDVEKKMAEEMKSLQVRSASILEAADKEAKDFLFQAEPEIVELVMAISRKVMMAEMEERRSAVLSLVRNALERVKDQQKINIRVNPEDYEFLLQSRRELQRVVGVDKAIMISVDPIVGRGGCSIDTAFGSVDAGIDTQLEMIRRAFQDLKS